MQLDERNNPKLLKLIAVSELVLDGKFYNLC